MITSHVLHTHFKRTFDETFPKGHQQNTTSIRCCIKYSEVSAISFAVHVRPAAHMNSEKYMLSDIHFASYLEHGGFVSQKSNWLPVGVNMPTSIKDFE